ncbi:MAG TPA: phosphoenolpyruvate carboxykinase [Sulfurospirillum sp. UBA12182]|nr:MAG TPA: phosphoenolpyruvate carboxykinase [Sulfurospirillum sp. UBA12182]
MFSVKEIQNFQIEVKKSHFLAFIAPISDFKTLHVKLKEEHPKANHIVWALRHLNEYNQIVENCSDDGEPKGTSGPPILNVMRGSELVDCAILVVRYFGGIKLGTGGLVRAYGRSAKELIENSILSEYVHKEYINFYTPFSLLSRFEHYFSSQNLEVAKRDFDANGATWSVLLSEEERKSFESFSSLLGIDIL